MTPASTGDTGAIVVRGKRGVRSLEDYLFGDRQHPVVALTRSASTNEPVLAPGAIRAIVGPEIRIYYIPGPYLLGCLQSVLGQRLALPQGTARIFWPGLSTRSDPGDHPLMLGLEGEHERYTLAEFARRFDLSRPHVRREIKLIEDVGALLELQLTQAIEQDRNAEERLRYAQIEPHKAARPVTATDQLSAMSCEERLHTLIRREWVLALTPSDRRENPLGAYVLTPRFLAMVEAQAELPQECLAWVCAMVAAGYAPALTDIAPHPHLAVPGSPQIERPDGAKGWRCNLKHNATGGARLHYWIRPDSTVEFAGVGNHDELNTT